MTNTQIQQPQQKNASKRFLQYALQIIRMVALFAVLLWYVDLDHSIKNYLALSWSIRLLRF